MSPFIWQTGAPSCMRTVTTERNAQKLVQGGMAMDMQGRRNVDLAPRSVGAISIHTTQDTNKTQRISRGRAI